MDIILLLRCAFVIYVKHVRLNKENHALLLEKSGHVKNLLVSMFIKRHETWAYHANRCRVSMKHKTVMALC